MYHSFLSILVYRNDKKKDTISYPPEYTDNTLPPDQTYFVEYSLLLFYYYTIVGKVIYSL